MDQEYVMKAHGDADRVRIVSDEIQVEEVIRDIIKTGMEEGPFYVFDVQDLFRKYENWKKKMPRIQTFYAVKCNEHPAILKTLLYLDIGFDCASKKEIKQILDLGTDASRIIYANPAKLNSHLSYAFENGIDLMTVDSETELEKIKALHPTAKVLIRIRHDAKICHRALGVKFGCHISDAPKLMQLAHILGINIVGICFHVGSGCGEPLAFRRAIKSAHNLFQIGKHLGFVMHILDIGGGFPGDKDTSIDSIADVVNQALDDYFPASSNVKIIAEPGRYFVASAFTLATLVYSKRVVEDPETGVIRNMFYINDGIYGTLNSIIHDRVKLQPKPLINLNNYELVTSSIWGPSCDSSDIISENIDFPNLNVGDWIIFENMGAYSYSRATSFNGFPVAKVYTIVRNSIMLPLQTVVGSSGPDYAIYFRTRGKKEYFSSKILLRNNGPYIRIVLNVIFYFLTWMAVQQLLIDHF